MKFCHFGVSAELKSQFICAAEANDRVASQVLRDLMREYVYRNDNENIWEPGAGVKRHQNQKN